MVMVAIGGAGLLAESVLVLLLCAPMPSNTIRGAVTHWVSSLWNHQLVQSAFAVTSIVNGCNLAMLFYALRQPYYQLGLGFGRRHMRALMEMGAQIELLRNERDAFISGTSLFLFVILRRLVRIQMQLHSARAAEKAAAADARSLRSFGQKMPAHPSQ
jgi:B-cell receptor-associated protein 31